MNRLAWVAQRLARAQIERETGRHLSRLRREPFVASQKVERELLGELASTPGPKVRLGETTWNEPVALPIAELVRSCGTIHGGTGSGKSMAACAILEAVIERLPGLRSIGIGVLDAKGELFDRAAYLLARRLWGLSGPDQEDLLRRIVIIDFSSREAISPYNILSRWPYTERDFFVTSRLETLRELLPAGEKLSLRGASVLKNALALLSEFELPLTYLNRVLESETLRSRLLSRSKNTEVRCYFGRHFAQEGRQTIAALRTRMDSLFASDGVRLALAGSTAPDFRRLQDEGSIVLVNCAGQSIARGVRLLLQGLVLSDIRQAIFARRTNPEVSYLWLADEAQNFFLTRQQQENMADILTMGRSFGSYFCFLCQNIATAIPDSRVLEILHTNTRWSLTLRGTPHDAQFLKAVLPVTGQRTRPDAHPFHERATYSLEEERSLALGEIAHLPDRTGYLWLKTRCPQAVMLRTRQIDLPEGEEFQQIVSNLREEPSLGNRIGRPEYERLAGERDREWLDSGQDSGDLAERFERRYGKERAAWHP